ncbi:MAG: radical SAM protein, partial [Bacteroidales bacterium]
MEARYRYLNELITKNKINFPDVPSDSWINPYSFEEYKEKRQQLLEAFHNTFLFNETKPYYNHISEGCRICGEGGWSCLFITGKCNASCFYCPASQNQDFIPSTQNLEFESPEAYAEYIQYFDFKAASFSGGEPLLVFDRTLSYLRELRKKVSPGLYVWLYTNGILADKNKLPKLADDGLDEIRFDIGATDYKLDKVLLAKGILNNITIEIPAIPEKKELIKTLLPEMIKAGVKNLNLHQLRLTTYNMKKLLKHDYKYFADEKPVVPDSELAALEIMNYAKKNSLNIGINYCSFSFKNRFQQAGYRKILSNKAEVDKTKITENGYLRNHQDNILKYEQITLGDKVPPSINQPLKLLHKTYYFSKLPGTNIGIPDFLRSLYKSIIMEVNNPWNPSNID